MDSHEHLDIVFVTLSVISSCSLVTYEQHIACYMHPTTGPVFIVVITRFMRQRLPLGSVSYCPLVLENLCTIFRCYPEISWLSLGNSRNWFVRERRCNKKRNCYLQFLFQLIINYFEVVSYLNNTFSCIKHRDNLH